MSEKDYNPDEREQANGRQTRVGRGIGVALDTADVIDAKSDVFSSGAFTEVP